MNKSTKYMFIIGLFLIEVTSLFLTFKSYANKEVDEIENANIIDNQTFAMYIENDSGEYDELLDSTLFPTDTHELNYELTTCVDNKGNSVDSSILAYSNGKVTATSNKTVFCYLYFEYLPKAYAIYSETDNSLRFYNNGDTEGMGDTYNGLAVTEVYTNFLNGESRPWGDSEYKTVITNIVVEEEIHPTRMNSWFNGMTNTSYLDLTNLNTAKVTNMNNVFANTGSDANVQKFEIIGLDNFDTSKVTNMQSMFQSTGQNANEWSIGDISKWNTSKVSNMYSMFLNAGQKALAIEPMDLSTKEIVLEDGTTHLAWDMSNITNMYGMFRNAWQNTENLNLNLFNWDTSKITSMGNMFWNTGYNSQECNLNVSDWDITNVTYIDSFFRGTCYNANKFSVDVSNWNVGNVQDAGYLFSEAGSKATEWTIGDLSNWNTSNITDMTEMFKNAGSGSGVWDIGDISKWNTSKVEQMRGIFWDAGRNAEKFNIGDLSTKIITKDDGTTYTAWDTSNVINMVFMFRNAGINSAEWNIGDISNWNTSSVTSMGWMFDYAGYSAAEWNIGDISIWNTSQVTTMAYMFQNAGKNATYELNLSTKEVTKEDGTTYTAWDVSNVTSYELFNLGVADKVIAPTWVN